MSKLAEKVWAGILKVLEVVGPEPALLALRSIAAAVEAEDDELARELRKLVLEQAAEHDVPALRLEGVRLGELGGGAVEARFAHAIGLVMENAEDHRTEAKAVRRVVVDVRIRPDEERRQFAIEATVKTKLAPRRDVQTLAFWGRTELGELVIAEHHPPVQMRLPEVEP